MWLTFSLCGNPVMKTFLTRRLPRLFANAHVTFFIGLLVAWEAMLAVPSCHTGPRYAAVALITATVCLAGWVAHLRVGEVPGWRRVLRVVLSALCDLVWFVLAVFVVAIPLALVAGHGDCYGPKINAAETILVASSLRQEINDRYTERKTLHGIGEGLEVPPGKAVSSGLVTPDGIIMVARDVPAIVVVLEPAEKDGRLEWTCLGAPQSLMPVACLP